MLNAATRERLDALITRAARRSLGIRTVNEPPYGGELYSPFRVVCPAESRDR